MSLSLQRTGKNHGAYLGDTIDIDQVLRNDLEAARRFGWEIDELPVSDRLDLLAFRRAVKAPRRKVYLSTGIHGDEPAGPLAVCQLLRENQWPDETDLWICPCLNPTGFPLNRRENADGVDLNRDYRDRQSAEIRAHIAWLERQPNFDLTLCLHEDWESHGFYVYEINPGHEPSRGERIVRAVSKVCPIDLSPVIEGRPAQGGIIRPDIDPEKRPQWPEAFYLVMNKTRHSYTLEAPSDFPLATRVAALVAAVRTALDYSLSAATAKDDPASNGEDPSSGFSP
jgi:murein peptide amidase A